jgi:enoyl-CoA hydratase/carnithine racemase
MRGDNSKMAIIYEKMESVGLIILKEKDTGNVINSELIVRLEDIQRQISCDRDVKVAMITAAGSGAFSLGTDMEEYSREEGIAWMGKHLSISRMIDWLAHPCIAAIPGDAFGQGLELALACDLRICSDSAHFAMNHLTHGDIPGDGGTQRLPRIVGRGKAMEMILTGEVINAQEAHRIGLVHRVVPEDELMPAAMDMAREIATKGPIAVRYVKEAIYKGMDVTLEQGLRLEADLYFLLHSTNDRTEGIRAFQEKRSPQFEGR